MFFASIWTGPGGCRSSASACCSSRRSWSAASTRRSSSASRSGRREKSLETPYIQRNIEATRDGLRPRPTSTTTAYNADDRRPPRAQLRDDADDDPRHPPARPQRRLADVPAAPADRSYYAVPRHPRRRPLQRRRHGHSDTVIAVRELDLDGLPDGQRNWINDHTVYTHGYGVVAAYGNRADADGRPVFYRAEHPAGRRARQVRAADLLRRAVAGRTPSSAAPQGAAAGARLPGRARDRPEQQHLHRRRRRRRSATPPGKLAFAIKYHEPNILLSDAVNPTRGSSTTAPRASGSRRSRRG